MSLVDRILKALPIKRKERPETRNVFVGIKPDDGAEEQRFPSNRIVSSKLIIDSPVSPITSGLPLAFVVILTALKQGYEDFLRHKADREVNRSPAYVFRDGNFVRVESHEIVVGDVVKVLSNEGIPCDMVMISSSSNDGECFITTANLDGETNLKKFRALLETKSFTNDETLTNLKMKIECEQPTTNLYKFIGTLNIFDGERKKVSLSSENVLLRGCCLKNTDFVMGCAIYTGQETKMGLNSRKSTIKFSRIEKTMNRFLIFYLCLLLFESALLVGLKHNFFSNDENKNLWYIDNEDSPSFKVIVEELLAFMILLNYTIPISMYVTVELQKFFGSMFFEWDREIYDPKTNEAARAITSDLNEELGQIEYLFTDKTGTLTENNMKFRQCSVNGIKFVDVYGKLCKKEKNIQPDPLRSYDEVIDLLKAVALCHTVRVEKVDKPNGVVNKGFSHEEECIPMSVLNDSADEADHNHNFQASSPDEKALVEACRDYGVIFQGTVDNVMKLKIGKTVKLYKLIHTLEFDPVRKRMSVMIQDERGDATLYVKGADSHIVPRLTGEKETVFSSCSDYAKDGLRTLVIAKKELSKSEFERDHEILTTAHNSVANRDENVALAYDQVERDLTLVGVTAVEDELQEGVPETLTSLRTAGIKVWVLTGDKEETAVNISYFAGHFDKNMQEMRLTNRISEEDCVEFLKQNKKILTDNVHGQYALIIDGHSLAIAQKCCRELLQEVCLLASTVLCCRMSPIQKADVVKLIKESKRHPTTAAIGDGANDVSMIQEAHVGIGLMGKEGRQAVRASDYAFGRFKFLRKAILVHGHYFYVRLAILVQYFFYKLMLETYYWCIPTCIGFLVTFIGYFVLTTIYSVANWPALFTPIFYRSFTRMCENHMWWLSILGLIVTCIVPDIVLRAIQDAKLGFKKSIYRRTSGRSIPYQRQEDYTDNNIPRNVTVVSNTVKGFANPSYDSAMESTHL
ncbi:DgyrCDS5779 [Dimorphilus gyrociliatus]|uniref:Phospholipid-transporting ATPase n=1 Tax=Dimorphilus gyrociliatus TaxID=2664684 RepID=A0A7I8VKX3_9ANNE|nr:DgyrCDS5779 [Dimorphilus gyrociliatus]